MKLFGFALIIGSMFMIPLALFLAGSAWWSWLLGIVVFACVLAAGARLTGWAIDNGY